MKTGQEIAEDILNESGNYSHLQKTQYINFYSEEEIRKIWSESSSYRDFKESLFNEICD